MKTRGSLTLNKPKNLTVAVTHDINNLVIAPTCTTLRE